MKKILLFILLISLTGLEACKKDYPEDIPDWLKTKIKELKKETRGKKNKCCYHIYECAFENTFIYDFRIPDGDCQCPNLANPGGGIGEIYDYDGNLICCYYGGEDLILHNCGGYVMYEEAECSPIGNVEAATRSLGDRQRLIWSEKPN